MATFRNDIVRSIRVPPLLSAHLPCYHTLGYLWVAHTLSQCSSLEEWWGIVQPLQSSSYVGLPSPNISGMRSVHNQMLVQWSTMNGPQLTQARATTLEPRISTYHFLSFPSILSSFNHFSSIKV
jgi:hypothetical protein